MEMRALGRQSRAVVPSTWRHTTPRPTRPQKVWASLAPEQQETVFRTIVTICRGLATRATQGKQREGASDDRC